MSRWGWHVLYYLEKGVLLDDIIMIGPIRFNPERHEVSAPGKTARLTPMENWVLRFLVDHANTVCATSQMSSSLYGRSDVSGLFKMHIRHIRQKIEQDPNNPVYILTVPGEGYKLVI